MRVIQLESGMPSKHFGIASVSFTTDGSQVLAQPGVIYSHWCQPNSNHHRIDVITGKVRTFDLPHDGLQWTWGDTVLSPDGRFVAAAGWGPASSVYLRLLPLVDGGRERGIKIGNTGEEDAWVAFSQDGTLHAAVNRPKKKDVALVHLNPEQMMAAPTKPLSFPEGYPVVEGLLRQTRLRDVRLPRVPSGPNYPGLSPDGRVVALWPETGPPLVVDSEDGRILLELPWPGRKVKQRTYHNAAISPGADRVAFLGGGLLLCARVAGSGKPWRAKEPMGYVTSAVFHPDGHTLLAVDRKGCAYRLDAATGKPLATYAWGEAMLMCVACNRDGTMAVAGRRGGEVVLWDLD